MAEQIDISAFGQMPEQDTSVVERLKEEAKLRRLQNKEKKDKVTLSVSDAKYTQISLTVDGFDAAFATDQTFGNPRLALNSRDLESIDDIVLDIDFSDIDGATSENGWGRPRKGNTKEFNEALNYTIQRMAIDVEPSNIFMFTYHIHPDNLSEAIDRNPYIIQMARHYPKTFKDIFKYVPDRVLANALSKNGLLLQYIPSSRLAKAHDNELCVTAVRQNLEAFAYVPVGAKFLNEKFEEVGRVDKNHTCLDNNVIDAFLSHSKNEPRLFRTLDPRWINENVVASALKYNFKALPVMVYDWQEQFFDKKYIPEHQPNSATVRVTRNVITELKPVFMDTIKQAVISGIGRVEDIPKDIMSPKLMGDIASEGSKAAKLSFQKFSYIQQLEYFKDKREANELSGQDYKIFDTRNIYTYPDGEKILEKQYPTIKADLSYFRNLNDLSEHLAIYSRDGSIDKKSYKAFEDAIRHFDWSFKPAHDQYAETMLANEKFDIAYSCVGYRGSMIALVYDVMYPNGIPSVELENKLNDLAIHKDPSCLPLIPRPTKELINYACEQIPENVRSTTPETIGQKNWDSYIVKSCNNNPEFFLSVMFSPSISDSLIRNILSESPKTAQFMLPFQFSPEVLGSNIWTDYAIDNIALNPKYIADLDSNRGCTKEFIERIATEVPEAVNHMTEHQLKLLNEDPVQSDFKQPITTYTSDVREDR